MEWLSSTVTDCYSIRHQQTNPVLARNAGSGFGPQRWAARRVVAIHFYRTSYIILIRS